MNQVCRAEISIGDLFANTEGSYDRFQDFLSETLAPLEKTQLFQNYYGELKRLYHEDRDAFFEGVKTHEFSHPAKTFGQANEAFTREEVQSFEDQCLLVKSLPKVDENRLDRARYEMLRHHAFQKKYDDYVASCDVSENLYFLKKFVFPYYSLPFSPELLSVIEENVQFYKHSAEALAGIPQEKVMMHFHNFLVEPGRQNTHLHKDFDTIFAHRYRGADVRRVAEVRYITYNLALTKVNADNTPLYVVTGDQDFLSPRYALLKAKDSILKYHKGCTIDDLLKAVAFAELGGKLNIIDLQSRGNMLNYPYYRERQDRLKKESILFVENEPGGGFFVTSNKNLHCSYTPNASDDYRMTSSMRMFTEDFLSLFYGSRTQMVEAVDTYLQMLSMIFAVPVQTLRDVFHVTSSGTRVPMCVQLDADAEFDSVQGSTLKMWKDFFGLQPVVDFLRDPELMKVNTNLAQVA